LDIIKHLAAAPTIAANDVAMTAAAQAIEVLARRHALAFSSQPMS
jgi:hypothetical protein